MPLVLKDRVKETTTTTGTGTLSLGGAASGYQTFSSAVGNGNTTYYAISSAGGAEWEVGIGTVGAGTLARTTVLASSNAGSAVNLSAGTKDVFVTYPAGKALSTDDVGSVVQAYDADLTSWAAIAPSAKQDTLVSGTNIKTVNSTSVLGSGDIAVQATLVSGTNIKTINSTSILGSGDITTGDVTLTGTQTLTNKTITGLRETRTASASNAFNLSNANYFTHTLSGATTFSVSNTASSGSVSAFVLDLTNGGSATITWWSGMKWAGGTAPTLTSSGRDVLAFFTHDGGTTWNGFVLGKDVK